MKTGPTDPITTQGLTSVTLVQLALRSPLLNIPLFLFSPLFLARVVTPRPPRGHCAHDVCMLEVLLHLFQSSTGFPPHPVLTMFVSPTALLWDFDFGTLTFFELYQIFLKSFTLWYWPHCEHQGILQRPDWDLLDATSSLTAASPLIKQLVYRCCKKNHWMVHPVIISTSSLCQFVV